MNRQLTSAAWSALITVVSIAGNYLQIGSSTPGRRLAHFASWPALPGQLAAALLGLGHGRSRR
jgi:hypothetical protein